jgi:hypothetical protein
MTNLKTVAMVGALLLGSSAIALAQTNSTTTNSTTGTSTMSPVTQPPDGSHPPRFKGTTSSENAGTSTGGTTTTAPGTQSAMRSDRDVVSTLKSAGYTDITHVKQDKHGYTASAVKNGKRVKVDIDSNGRIETLH